MEEEVHVISYVSFAFQFWVPPSGDVIISFDTVNGFGDTLDTFASSIVLFILILAWVVATVEELSVLERFVLGGGKLDGRPDDAIGLVAFASYAETRSPLTLDHGNLAQAARDVTFAREGEDATAIGAGLELAVARLSEYKAASKVAILLTDGESNIHDIDEDTAIDDAIKAGVKVYTIGAGTTGVAPIRIPRGDGTSELRQMEVSIDETLLRKIADKTHGQYFRATDHAGLVKIYEAIDKLERTTIEEERFTEYRQFYGRFVAIAMLLVLGAFVLRGTLLRRLP